MFNILIIKYLENITICIEIFKNNFFFINLKIYHFYKNKIQLLGYIILI